LSIECRVKESVTRIFWRKVVDLLLALKFHQVGGDISIDRLIARICSLVPSPRANGRLACGPRGVHHFEIPGAEPPNDSIGSLAALMEHARTGAQAPSPPPIGRLAGAPHGARGEWTRGPDP